jgi:hypothetical protein
MILRSRIIPGLGLTVTALMLAAIAASGVAADARFTQAGSDAFHRKLNTIVNGGAPTATTPAAKPATTGKNAAGKNVASTPAPVAPAGPKQTSILENEVNSYLRFELRDQVPAGVTEPTITIVGDGRLAGSAIVDLDAVKQSRQSTSWFDPMRLLSGKLPVAATGVLQTQQGTGRFVLESAEISGIPVPKTVLQQVVSYYSRNAQNPNGVNLDDAFELPAKIREIRVQPGQAIVVQ